MTGCYWSTEMTSNWQVHLGMTRYSNRDLSWQQAEEDWVCISLTPRTYGCILWLKVLTPKPATYRKYYIMTMLNTSQSQTYKRFANNRSAVVFPLLLCSWHFAVWQRGRTEQDFQKWNPTVNMEQGSYSINWNIDNKIWKYRGWLWIESIKGNRQRVES